MGPWELDSRGWHGGLRSDNFRDVGPVPDKIKNSFRESFDIHFRRRIVNRVLLFCELVGP